MDQAMASKQAHPPSLKAGSLVDQGRGICHSTARNITGPDPQLQEVPADLFFNSERYLGAWQSTACQTWGNQTRSTNCIQILHEYVNPSTARCSLKLALQQGLCSQDSRFGFSRLLLFSQLKVSLLVALSEVRSVQPLSHPFVLLRPRMQVNDDSWGKQLVNVIKGDPDYQAGKAKTLIFTKDTATADAASSLLHSAGVK
eukprot:1162124-Pelagomonas_calceolata.AAC.4